MGKPDDSGSSLLPSTTGLLVMVGLADVVKDVPGVVPSDGTEMMAVVVEADVSGVVAVDATEVAEVALGVG